MTREISTRELRTLQRNQETFALIHVLSEDEHRSQSIAGSENAPVDSPDFLPRVWRLTGGDKHMCVVVYCAGPRCRAATRAANCLVDAGYTHVLEYRGGIEVWHSSPRGRAGRHGNGIASGEARDALQDEQPEQKLQETQAQPIPYDRALQDPAAVFTEPEEVLQHERLNLFEKLEVLQRWAHDADRLAVAEIEGMGGGEPSMLGRVLRVLLEVEEMISESLRPHQGLARPGELLGRE
jgi:rhodanese-related sulfurtransferase